MIKKAFWQWFAKTNYVWQAIIPLLDGIFSIQRILYKFVQLQFEIARYYAKTYLINSQLELVSFIHPFSQYRALVASSKTMASPVLWLWHYLKKAFRGLHNIPEVIACTEGWTWKEYNSVYEGNHVQWNRESPYISTYVAKS